MLMRKRSAVVSVVVAGAGLLALTAFQVGARPAQPLPMQAGPRWEYATFTERGGGQVSLEWGGRRVSGMNDVAQALGIERALDAQVLNALGAGGWELVAVTVHDEPVITTFRFKRAL